MLCEALLLIFVLYVTYLLLDFVIRFPKIKGYHEKYVFVTGCDTGFGKFISIRLDSLGFNVFSGCYTDNGIQELKIETSQRLTPFRLDVSNQESIKEAFDLINSKIPADKGLWAVVNNAGVGGELGPPSWMTSKEYRAAMDVNFFPLVDITTTFLPLLESASGRIVNMASVLGRFSFHSLGPYVASKFAVEGMSDAYRRGLRSHGVSVHLIEPGFFKTNITDVVEGTRKFLETWRRLNSRLQKQYPLTMVQKFSAGLSYQNEKLCSPNVDKVVDSYERAITDLRPRARYVVGNDAKFIFLFMQALPEWISDFLITRLDMKPMMQ